MSKHPLTIPAIVITLAFGFLTGIVEAQSCGYSESVTCTTADCMAQVEATYAASGAVLQGKSGWCPTFTPTPTQGPTGTPTPTATPSATPTTTPTATFTVTPTVTPTPTATFTVTPTVTPTPVVTIASGLTVSLDASNVNSYSGSGASWGDVSGSGYSATLTGFNGQPGPTYSASNGGNIVFDGLNDYAVLGSSLDFANFSNGFTIGFWVKVLNTSQTNRYLFSKRTSSGSDNQFSIIYGYTANTFELYSGAGQASSNIRTNSMISVNDNDWHFLYYTVGATTVGYLDGVAKFTNTYPGLTFTASTANNLIASFNGSGFWGNFAVGNMVIYNRILTGQEVAQNFNATRTTFGK